MLFWLSAALRLCSTNSSSGQFKAALSIALELSQYYMDQSMKHEGFIYGEKAIVRKGARMTTNNGKVFIKDSSHEQIITIQQLLDKDGDRPLLVC